MQPPPLNNKNEKPSGNSQKQTQITDPENKNILEEPKNPPECSCLNIPQSEKIDMEESHSKKISPSNFAPFSAKILEVEGNAGFFNGANLYIEKYDMIITCPTNNTIQFYNATTLLPAEGRKTLELEGSVIQISYDEETDLCLFGCMGGHIYSYDLANKIHRKMSNFHAENHIPAITFLSSEYYAFSGFFTRNLFIGSFENKKFLWDRPKDSDTSSFYRLKNKSLLLSGLANSSLRIYRLDQLPDLPIVCFVKGRKDVGVVVKIENVEMNGKEYIITADSEGVIRIWNLVKGKMRLLRVIMLGEKVTWFVFLEKEKMIVTAHVGEEIKFWKLLSGKLEFVYCSQRVKCKNIFLMKDGMAIGLADHQKNIIEIVKLRE